MNLRDQFYAATSTKLAEFLELIRTLERDPAVIKAYEHFPDNLKNGRSFGEMALDDLIDAFEEIMEGVSEDKIPVAFYARILAQRERKQLSKEAVRNRLTAGLEKQELMESKPSIPLFIQVIMHDLSTQKVADVSNKMLQLGNALFKLMASEELLVSEQNMFGFTSRFMNSIQSVLNKRLEQNKPENANPKQDENTDENNKLAELREKAEQAGMSEEALAQVKKQLERMSQMHPASPEYSTLNNYVDWLVSVPWSEESKLNTDISQTEDILDEDHYGMEKVKEAIAEHIAVQNHVGGATGSILCIVGPPGVGKTSIAKSIAKATGRAYERVALGGVHNEAEIRGHRRTYIGAQPGTIVKAMKKAGTRNPLIVLDEIDKIGGMTHNGDPSAALLEVLDPAQNHTFRDNYLDVSYDLSKVMFFCTANYLGRIPPALRDRLEIIQLSGYNQEEKFEIAKRHLIPQQLNAKGLSDDYLSIDDASLRLLISDYTRESGVRQLEKQIGKLCRKAVMALEKGRSEPITITAETLKDYLGPSRVTQETIPDRDIIGQVNGLAYTSVGGCLLPIETVSIPSASASLTVTGNLGKVMEQSVTVAKGVIESRADSFGIDRQTLNKTKLQLHAPAGAIPKDGPSAGLAITTAMISTLTGVPVRRDIAMTGEISLNGRAMPIGGLPEKLEGALLAGVKTVLIPEANAKDLSDVPAYVKSGLEIITVSHIDDVLAHALTENVIAKAAKAKKEAEAQKEAESIAAAESTEPAPAKKQSWLAQIFGRTVVNDNPIPEQTTADRKKAVSQRPPAP